MSAARERVQQEADERYPDSYGPRIQGRTVATLERRAFIAGRTIRVGSAEWIDAVNQAEAYLDGLTFWEPDDRRTVAAGLVHTVLTGAGFIVEGADDD